MSLVLLKVTMQQASRWYWINKDGWQHLLFQHQSVECNICTQPSMEILPATTEPGQIAS